MFMSPTVVSSKTPTTNGGVMITVSVHSSSTTGPPKQSTSVSIISRFCTFSSSICDCCRSVSSRIATGASPAAPANVATWIPSVSSVGIGAVSGIIGCTQWTIPPSLDERMVDSGVSITPDRSSKRRFPTAADRAAVIGEPGSELVLPTLAKLARLALGIAGRPISRSTGSTDKVAGGRQVTSCGGVPETKAVGESNNTKLLELEKDSCQSL